MMIMKKLTQAEEQIMQVLWQFDDGGYIKDLLEQLPEPKPHHNTVATLLKILVEKQFVGVKNPNRNNLYFPLVSKAEYSEQRIAGFSERFFAGSYTNLVSFLIDKKQMSIEDLELLLTQLKNKDNE
jgi:BlaI family penicillinase repressor